MGLTMKYQMKLIKLLFNISFKTIKLKESKTSTIRKIVIGSITSSMHLKYHYLCDFNTSSTTHMAAI